MDTMIVFLIGALSVSYLGYVLWKGVTGKSGCNCGESCTKSKNGNSCCSHK